MTNNYLIFAAQYLPHLGGLERYNYNLAKQLIKKGKHVTIVTSNVQHIAEFEQMEGAEIYRVPCINVLKGRYPVLRFWSSKCRSIYRELEKKEYDLVIVNTRFYLHSIWGVRYGKKHGHKTIVIEHGTSHLSIHNKILDTVGGWWEHFITIIDRFYCKDYYGVSLACCEWLKHFHIKSKGVLYNAIDLKQIQTIISNKRGDFRQEYHIPKDAKVIAYTGRMLKEKGIIPLIASVERILKERDDVYLLLAGDGDLDEYVKEHASEHIIPLGRLSFEHIIEMLVECDIFCLPSFSEGFSTSVLEAVACGCYVITTERGGSKEMITSRDYGMIIKNGDEINVYNSLVEIIDKDEEREEVAKVCLEKLEKNYTWDIVSDHVISLADGECNE